MIDTSLCFSDCTVGSYYFAVDLRVLLYTTQDKEGIPDYWTPNGYCGYMKQGKIAKRYDVSDSTWATSP